MATKYTSELSYDDENDETYTRECTDPDGITMATNREEILVWISFLGLVHNSHILIVPPSELTTAGACRRLGRGATMVVSEHIWSKAAKGGTSSKPSIVAVKKLIFQLPDKAEDLRARPERETELLARFTLELRALCHGSLRSHPNIVRLLGVTWAEKGLPALIVERASKEYPTLDRLIDGKSLRGVQKADILAGIAEGLGAIHSVSLIHGDLKPANVLLFETDSAIVPKLSDFAFSRSSKEDEASGGTEYWNAPECCAFRDNPARAGDSDARSPRRDLFSLGLIFWNMLYETKPFVDLGGDDDYSIPTRRRITEAKETGFLLKKLESECKKYESFMFEAQQLTEDNDDEDAVLSIVECIKDLLQPIPGNRTNPYQTPIPVKLRRRRRLVPETTLVWDGEKLTGDIWPDMEKVIEELKLQAESSSTRETGIRLNLWKDLNATSATMQKEILLRNEVISADVSSMIEEVNRNTLTSEEASAEQRANAAWFLAQLAGARKPEERLKYCLEAAKLGNEHARVNYLYLCFRDSHPVSLDFTTQTRWFWESLTSGFCFKQTDPSPASTLKEKLRLGFAAFVDSYKADTSNHVLDISREAFIRNVIGGTYPPHDQVFNNNRWQTLVTAKERTFDKFRQGLGDMKDTLNLDVLHTTAVYGTGDVVRDLVRTHAIPLERLARTSFHPGEATALQAAFLSHNMSTISALIDLGADVLPLFSKQTLEQFLIEGDRQYLHWLNHLIPLMRHEKNRRKARGNFDSILLCDQAVQCTVVQVNWSLFLGILELRQKLTDGELKSSLEIAVCTRKVEFVLALLISDQGQNTISSNTLEHMLYQTCRPWKRDLARQPIFRRHYLGLKKSLVDSIPTPHDISYGLMITDMILRHAVAYRDQLGIKCIGKFLVGSQIQAAFFNRPPILRHLLAEYGADPTRTNEDGETILSIATYRNNYHMTKYILSLPAIGRDVVNNKNFIGDTALHVAAKGTNLRILKMLISHEASLTPVGFLDRNVLHISANKANKRAFCLLFDHIEQQSPATLKEIMQQRDKTGATPLHLFLGADPKDGTTNKPPGSQDLNSVRILQTKLLPYVVRQDSTGTGIINAPDSWDLTPLHHLVLFGGDMPETLTFLLRRGGADFERLAPRIADGPWSSPRQILLLLGGREKPASLMALMMMVSGAVGAGGMGRGVSGGANGLLALVREMASARENWGEVKEMVWRRLEERVRALNEQEAGLRKELREKFARANSGEGS